MKQLSFSLAKQHAAFQLHFDESRNERVIFSGAFGIGKTYFLNDYFQQYEADYVTVKLSPVNYSVSATEDIFRLIKYDILFELLVTDKLLLESESISREVAYGVALQDKLPAIANGLVGMLPLLNKETADVVSVWSSLMAVLPFFKEVEAARKDPNMLRRIEEFGRETGKLSALEEDFITVFIEQTLSRLAISEDKTKPKVLVIDDLDRIDPEHIFRLFNVFSAHLDYNRTARNKFGFDKVVFVCDIQNIRNIFHSRYGANTDFTGYIDKFYSLEVYRFDNSAEVKELVSQFIEGITPTSDFKTYFAEFIAPPRRESNLLSILLTETIHAGALTIRRLRAVHGIPYRHEVRPTGFKKSYDEANNWAFPAIITLEVLTWVVGGVEALERALNKLLQYQRSNEYNTRSHRDQEYLAAELLPVLDFKGHQFKIHASYGTDAAPAYEFVNPNTQQRLAYRLYGAGDWRNIYLARIEAVDGVQFREQNLGSFDLVHQTFTLLLKQGILR